MERALPISPRSAPSQRRTSRFGTRTRLASGLLALFTLGAVEAPVLAAEPQRGGTIRYGHLQEPPCLYGGWIQQWYLQRQYGDNLVARGKGGEILPWLASNWTLSDDKTVYTFELRPGVTFHDGTPLDAAAVAANFSNWLSADPLTRNNASVVYFGDQFKSATATGPLTVRVELKEPYQPFLDVLTHATHIILSPTAFKRGQQANCEQPIGSGPFIVEKWNQGQDVVFRRNPDYAWAPANAKHQGPAYADILVWKFLKDPTLRYGSLTAGESDVIYDVPAVNWADAQKKYQIVSHITGGSPLRFQLNTERPPFDDPRVRRAFAYAADRRAAVEAAFQGQTPFEGNGALSQSAPEYVKALADSYPYDPKKAAELLDAAGWTKRDADGIRQKDGKPLLVRIVYSQSHVTLDGAQALQIIQEQAREAGFKVELKPVTQSDWYAGKNRGPADYEIQPAYWTAATAEIFRVSWRPDYDKWKNANNVTRYQDQDLWRIIQEADGSFDDERRTALYGEVEKRLVEEAPVIGFTVLPVVLASQPKLHDVWLSSAVGEPVFHDAWFEK